MARFAKPVARLRHGLLVSGGGTGGPDPTRRQTMAPKQAIRRLHAMPRPIAPPHWPLGGHLSSPQSRRPSGLDQALRDSTHHARSARPTRRPPASTHAKIHATRTDESCHWARNVIEGIEIALVAQILDHKDIRTTMKHYNDLRAEDTRPAMDRVPDISLPSSSG